jgi:hypothetical protein
MADPSRRSHGERNEIAIDEFAPTRLIVLSELSAREKEKYYNILIAQNAKILHLPNGPYTANVRMIAPKTSAKDAVQKKREGIHPTAFETRLKRLQARYSLSVQIPQSYAFNFSAYSRFSVIIADDGDVVQPKPRSLNWLMRIVEDLYDARFRLEKRDRERGSESDELASIFPVFVVKYLSTAVGLSSLIDQTCWDVLYNTHIYRTEFPEVERFARFLQEYYNNEDLLFFLYMRSIVGKMKKISFRSNWVNKSEPKQYESASPSYSAPQSAAGISNSFTASGSMCMMSYTEATQAAKLMFSESGDWVDLRKRFLSMLSATMIGAQRDVAAGGADTRRIDVAAFLNLTVAMYHDASSSFHPSLSLSSPPASRPPSAAVYGGEVGSLHLPLPRQRQQQQEYQFHHQVELQQEQEQEQELEEQQQEMQMQMQQQQTQMQEQQQQQQPHRMRISPESQQIQMHREFEQQQEIAYHRRPDFHSSSSLSLSSPAKHDFYPMPSAATTTTMMREGPLLSESESSVDVNNNINHQLTSSPPPHYYHRSTDGTDRHHQAREEEEEVGAALNIRKGHGPKSLHNHHDSSLEHQQFDHNDDGNNIHYASHLAKTSTSTSAMVMEYKQQEEEPEVGDLQPSNSQSQNPIGLSQSHDGTGLSQQSQDHGAGWTPSRRDSGWTRSEDGAGWTLAEDRQKGSQQQLQQRQNAWIYKRGSLLQEIAAHKKKVIMERNKMVMDAKLKLEIEASRVRTTTEVDNEVENEGEEEGERERRNSFEIYEEEQQRQRDRHQQLQQQLRQVGRQRQRQWQHTMVEGENEQTTSLAVVDNDANTGADADDGIVVPQQR